jgi:hypothetical protein
MFMLLTKLLPATLIACALAGAVAAEADEPAAAAAALAPAAAAAALAPAAAAPALAPATASATPSAPTAVAGAATYKVVEGYKVDAFTLVGFHTWRQAACDRCHGANQEGLVGPSLIESLKVLDRDAFIATLTNGRPEKGMPQWKENPTVMNNINQLYAYLKGRSDGAITRAKVVPMTPDQ